MPKIQLRHDTSTNWTTYNPVLLEGECGVETDTNKFKFGDGTTAWNSLDYVGEVDLSNYYNKTEVNGLLDEKQDLLTPNEPLTITSYSKNNAVNMTSEDGKIWTENPSTYVSWLTNRDEGNDLATFNDSDMGYIDIPYTIGQIVKLPVPAYTTEAYYGYAVQNGGWTTAFGGYYDENQNFCPVFHIHPPSSYSWYDTYFYLHPKNEMRYSSRGYEFVDRTTANMGDVYTKDTSPELGIAYFQMKEVSGTYTFCEESNTSKDGASTIYKRKWTYTGADTLMLEVLGKVCAIRIYPGQFSGGNFGSSSDPKYFMDTQAISKASGFDVTSFGLYEANDTLDNIALTSLTNNLFDLGGSTTLTYLDLSIGTGLAIQDGNLVNTNPTPYSLPTATTSALGGVKVDGTTITIDGNGVISSSGGGGGDLTNYYNKSETDTLLEDYIPNSSVATPLEYSVSSHSIQSITTTGSDKEYCYLTNSNSNSLTFSGDYTKIYTVKTTSEGILDDDYNIVANYDDLISNESPWIVFNYAQDYSRNSNQTRYTPTIGHIDTNGVFTPYILCDMGLYGDRLFIGASSTSTESTGYTTYTITGSSIYQENWNDPENYSGVMIKLEVSGLNVVFRCKIIQNDGTIADSVWDNKTLGTLVDLQNYELNAVLFNTTSYFASNSSNLLKVAETGIFSTTELTSENQLWSMADTTYTKYLRLNIGSGLAIQNNNLVNTNPTAPSVDQTYDGTSSNAQSGTAVAEALSSFTITNINGGNA